MIRFFRRQNQTDYNCYAETLKIAYKQNVIAKSLQVRQLKSWFYLPSIQLSSNKQIYKSIFPITKMLARTANTLKHRNAYLTIKSVSNHKFIVCLHFLIL